MSGPEHEKKSYKERAGRNVEISTAGATILVVDDEPHNYKLIRELLKPQGYTTIGASSGEEALVAIAKKAPDLILLDVMMPIMNGYELARIIKSDPETLNIPIIMVTAKTDHRSRMAGLEAGAEEFLSKPVDRHELWARVRNLLRLKVLSDFFKNHSAILEKQVQERTADLQHLAHYDSLTGLPNRTLFYQTLEKTITQTTTDGNQIAVLFVDLDHFKDVNDKLGHASGDNLLHQFAGRLSGCVRTRDTIGRLGGDEFALILTMRPGHHGATHVANKIREALRAPFDLDGHSVTITASIGITVHPDDASDPESLIKFADTAMYQAKQAGRDAFRFFTTKMNTEAQWRMQMETALRAGIKNNELILHYQPKINANTGRIVGLEALLRWQRPGHGLITPDVFVPILEETGLIVQAGCWVIDNVCKQIRQWMDAGLGQIQVAVNVAARQFLDIGFEQIIANALSQNNLPGKLLELELTESTLMTSPDTTASMLRFLKGCGVSISVDDFGTGHSCLLYLCNFPINKLKIDMSFISNMTINREAAAIVKTVIQLAHNLKLQAIAEGVETAAQLDYLNLHGCDQFQGYHCSPAVEVNTIEKMLRKEMLLAL